MTWWALFIQTLSSCYTTSWDSTGSPFDSQCVYMHNRSDKQGLGPPTTLAVDVFSDDLGPVRGGLELAGGENCDDPEYPGADSLHDDQRTIGPGEMFRARVRMHLAHSPGEGPFGFAVTFVGVGTEDADPAIVAADVAESDNTHLMVNMRFPRPRLLTVQTHDGPHLRVAMPGLDTVAGEPGSSGQPETCVDRRLAAVPRGGPGGATQVSFLAPEPRLRGVLNDVDVYPVQETPVDLTEEELFGDPPFVKDTKAYSTDAFFPRDVVQVVHLGRMTDLDLIQINVACSQYNPVTRELRVYEGVDYELQFQGGSGYFVTERANNPFEPSARSLYSVVLNQDAIFQYVDPTDLPTFACIGNEYLIITDPAFRDAADDLAAWKNTKGISTKVVETGSDAGDAGTTKEEIQQYIRDRYDGCIIRPSYVLLPGDDAEIPPSFRTYGTQTPATDLDYALMDDADIMPDLAIGRIPVSTLTQAQTVVDKTIGYEKTPPADASFYDNISFASYFQCCQDPITFGGFELGGVEIPETTIDGVDMRAYIETSELVRDHLTGEGYTVERIYTTYNSSYSGNTTPDRDYDTTLMPSDLNRTSGFAWDGGIQDIVDAINAGRFLMLHRDHGGSSGWSKPSFRTSDLGSLANGELLPVIFSVNCASGRFDGASGWAEQILRQDGGGAVGVLGDTRNSPTWANNAITRGFFDAVFPDLLPSDGSSDRIVRLGDILNYGKAYMAGQVGVTQAAGSISSSQSDGNIVMWHVFGDPTLELWTAKPLLILPSVLELLQRQQDLWRIAYPINGALVTVLLDGIPVGRARVVNGVAELHLVQGIDPVTPLSNFAISATHPDATSVVLAPPSTEPAADVEIVKTGDRETARIGENVTYTLTVTNGGPGQATNVLVDDFLPNFMSHVSSTSTSGDCFQQTGGIHCNLGSMEDGDTVTIHLVARADAVGLRRQYSVGFNQHAGPGPEQQRSTSPHYRESRTGGRQNRLAWAVGPRQAPSEYQ